MIAARDDRGLPYLAGSNPRSWPWLLGSGLLHAALVASVLFGVRPRAESADGPDAWLGTAIEIEANAAGPSAASEPSAAAVPGAPASDAVSEAESESAPQPVAEPDRTPGAERASEPRIEPRAPAAQTPAVADATPPRDPTAAAPRPERQPPESRAPAPTDATQESAPERSGPKRDVLAGEAAPAPSGAAWEKFFGARASASGGGESAGAYGAAAAAGPVRPLAKAFTRAIPVATNADRSWAQLALGAAGSVRVTITVDAQGRIESALLDDQRVPRHLERLVQKTVALIRQGRFALQRGDAQAGSQTLRIDATLSAEPPPGASRLDDFGLGFEAPLPGRPGKAYFRAWGRYMEARVTIERTQAAR